MFETDCYSHNTYVNINNTVRCQFVVIIISEYINVLIAMCIVNVLIILLLIIIMYSSTLVSFSFPPYIIFSIYCFVKDNKCSAICNRYIVTPIFNVILPYLLPRVSPDLFNYSRGITNAIIC